jgi:hypothetical protein
MTISEAVEAVACFACLAFTTWCLFGRKRDDE